MPARPFFIGSEGWVRSMDLRLLVHAQHHGLVRRAQVQTYNVDQLLLKVTIMKSVKVFTK